MKSEAAIGVQAASKVKVSLQTEPCPDELPPVAFDDADLGRLLKLWLAPGVTAGLQRRIAPVIPFTR